MKKFPKLVQCDKRGQIVIPKEVRQELGIEEGSGFYMYVITEEGILLKKVEEPVLNENDPLMRKITEKADKIDVNQNNIKQTMVDYKKTSEGGLDLI